MAADQLHMVFFPLMAQGHMIPLFDLARLFTSRGVKSTVITTPSNAPIFSDSNTVELEIIRFPSEEAGLPAGLENVDQLAGSTDADVHKKFLEALKLMERPLEELLQKLRPTCLVSDLFLPWTADVAFRIGIPRVGFHGAGYFAMSVSDAIRRHQPQWKAGSQDEFVVPGLPGEEVRMSRSNLPWASAEESEMMKLAEWAVEAEARSFGLIMNSFYELEAHYVDYYRKVTGRRCWSLGPLSLFTRNSYHKTTIRDKKIAVDVNSCMSWLDSKPLNSVIYICFGSIVNMGPTQLREIAKALDSSNHHFIWVIKTPINTDNKLDEEEWLPSGFESNEHKGLIIRGWAPQVMILNHRAIGGFVTHCGWNSILDGVSAGVPMVTWPVAVEQFMNEKLVTQILRVGVPVGDTECRDHVVDEEEIVAAMGRVMAAEMRRRASELKELAWKAVKFGGSSYNDLNQMLEELCSLHANGE